MSNKKISFGVDFSGATTTGPVQSLLLAYLVDGPRTAAEIRAKRTGFSAALRGLLARGLVEERTSTGGAVRFALSTRAARQIASQIREAPLTRRFGIVVSGVPARNDR